MAISESMLMCDIPGVDDTKLFISMMRAADWYAEKDGTWVICSIRWSNSNINHRFYIDGDTIESLKKLYNDGDHGGNTECCILDTDCTFQICFKYVDREKYMMSIEIDPFHGMNDLVFRFAISDMPVVQCEWRHFVQQFIQIVEHL